ncbi:potassium/proton antiporter [Prosthecomicrobium pneumaticum]|uniref:Cell volume regulation protein A n=1 Tax=Prosthecomicrobium pneumaticum TaxID=81895 RepID=A0A7W9FPZ9_9HYPH|nr:potassium/proton antiporter [Prosthecomicrobium pneumaticum]MBB5754651.1 cell volume regulation protein A [Prosthecomicrobium pneumaticum]
MLEAMSLAILIGSLLVVGAVFTSLFSARFGAPILLVFLLVGLLAGEDGLGIEFSNFAGAYFIGSIALAIILFESGFETRWQTLKIALGPSLLLATLGVLVTAGLVGLGAHLLFDWSWLASLLLGTIVASTDAAAVFFLLRVGGISLRDRVRSTLEVESGSNDPMAIFLTIALVGIAGAGAARGEEQAILSLMRSLVTQIGFGGLLGLLGGVVIARIAKAVEFEPALQPIVVLAFALVLFAATNMVGGSGFLAVYCAGLVCGNTRIRHALAVRRFQRGMSWLAQIAMFLTLGLLAAPSDFPAVLLPAIALALVLMLLARPLAVWLCLLPFGFSRHETAFIAWVGLRGAVSILLAIVPLIGGVPEGRAIFNVAFVVVLVSLIVQGWTIGRVARFLGLVVPSRQGLVERIELELPGRGDHEVVAYRVHPDSAVGRGGRIPRWARPSLVLRDGRSLRFETAGRLQDGDQVYIVTATDHIRLLDHLFARPAETAGDAALFGDFGLSAQARMGELGDAYGFEVPEAVRGQTVADVIRETLDGDIEEGDRVACGPVDLIVRRVDEDRDVAEVGLALERSGPRPRLPLFQNRREIAAWLRTRRAARKARRDAAAAPPVPKRDDESTKVGDNAA